MALQRVDRNRDDHVSAEDLVAFLSENRIFDVAAHESRYFIDYFDADEDHRLSFAE